MRTITTIFDDQFRHISVFGCIPPITPKDVIGFPAWHFSGAEQAEVIRHNLSECLRTGESRAYRVTALPPFPRLFLCRVCRVAVGEQFILHCVADAVPVEVQSLAPDEVATLRAIGQHEQKEAAHNLGVSVSAMSHRERALREKLGVDSRYELRRIGVVLADEHAAAN